MKNKWIINRNNCLPVEFIPEHWLFCLQVTTAVDTKAEERSNKLEKILFWERPWRTSASPNGRCCTRRMEEILQNVERQ